MSRLKRFVLILIVVAISPIHFFAQATSSSKPIRIKVVVVAMFERGEDTGDTPGEYQLWVEREHLDQIIPPGVSSGEGCGSSRFRFSAPFASALRGISECVEATIRHAGRNAL